jgi:CMP/dCMP kinase
MTHKDPVITIDGASGTGKGTISQLLATQLNWKLLDSGALYRVLALAAQKHRVSLDNEEGLEVLAEHLDVQFIAKKNEFPHIILEGENVTDIIRSEHIGNNASIVAALPVVRAALLSRQRAFREPPGLVADGRDMGTVIFPDADLKVFLEASLETRAHRRFNQLKQRGIDVNLADLITDLDGRDKRDQERLVSPLRPAEDAVSIVTDSLTIEQVVEKILQECSKKKAFPAIAQKNAFKSAEAVIAD